MRLINNLIFIFLIDIITYIVYELDSQTSILNLSLKLNRIIILVKKMKHLTALKLRKKSLFKKLEGMTFMYFHLLELAF